MASNSWNSGIERRRHRRVEYPFSVCPFIRIGGRRYRVLDLSASGLRFELLPAVPLTIAAAVPATLSGKYNVEVPLFGDLNAVAPGRLVFLPQGLLHGSGCAGIRTVPDDARVALRVCGQEYEVAALSTHSIELRRPNPFPMDPFPGLAFQVTFADGNLAMVVARLTRIQADHCAVRLSQLLPQSRVLKEQSLPRRRVGEGMAQR